MFLSSLARNAERCREALSYQIKTAQSMRFFRFCLTGTMFLLLSGWFIVRCTIALFHLYWSVRIYHHDEGQGIKKNPGIKIKIRIRSTKIKKDQKNIDISMVGTAFRTWHEARKNWTPRDQKKCEYFFDSFICLIRVMAPGSFGTRNRTSSSSRSRSMVVVSNRRKFRSQTSDNMDR